MKLLFLAPEPFFQERGTPIAVKLALEVLARRQPALSIDLLCYGEGAPVEIPGVNIHRIWQPALLRGVRPGISLKKMICDLVFFVQAIALILKQAGEQPYALIHGIEESVFCALLAKYLFGIPYVYDMDSSIALQVIERWQCLGFCTPAFRFLENLAIRNAFAVIPVCPSLAEIAHKAGASSVTILSDVSLLADTPENSSVNLRAETGTGNDEVLLTYIGNLEHYQGIDLLIEAYSLCCRNENKSRLIIIGGRSEHIAHYRRMADKLGIADRLVMAGQKPLSSLNHYTRQSDILLSPRTQGNNTPMKIYSYLHAGRALLATRLPTHTQVLTDEVAMLCAPEPKAFADALQRLVDDTGLRNRLGTSALRLAEQKYTLEAFSATLNGIYNDICTRLRLRTVS